MHDKYYQVQSKTKRKYKEKVDDTNTFKIDLDITWTLPANEVAII